MSVARAREFVARCRAAGIVVHESPDCYSRGNGQTSAYEGFEVHHTGTAFGMAPRVLWDGRPDLPGPLCNTAGNVDGSVTLVAAHPANHAGASGGWDTAPLPRTSLFNKLVWGHEIVYPGAVPMNAQQYRTALIVSRIGVDIWGYGDTRRIKFHQGTSITGKWDPGYAPGRTVDIAAFRSAAVIPEPEPPKEEDEVAIPFLARRPSTGEIFVADGHYVTYRHVKDMDELAALKWQWENVAKYPTEIRDIEAVDAVLGVRIGDPA